MHRMKSPVVPLCLTIVLSAAATASAQWGNLKGQFTYNGKAIRMKHGLRLLSPYNYKVAITVSVDGGPFKNYGNPWWRKDAGTK